LVERALGRVSPDRHERIGFASVVIGPTWLGEPGAHPLQQLREGSVSGDLDRQRTQLVFCGRDVAHHELRAVGVAVQQHRHRGDELAAQLVRTRGWVRDAIAHNSLWLHWRERDVGRQILSATLPLRGRAPDGVSMLADAITIGDVAVATKRIDVGGQGLRFADANAGRTLPAGEVHVWRASLERPRQIVQRMRCVLAGDEQRRADRFRFERDRSRYIVGRALLRGLLAGYLDTAPEGLQFQYGEFSKPALRGGPGFNVSHSGSIALYAFSSVGEIGIDVELDDADFARERISERFFST